MGKLGQAIIALPREFAGHGTLPVRIRDTKGVLVASGLSGEPVLIESGTYSLSVLLPSGEEKFSATPLKIKPRKSVEAELNVVNSNQPIELVVEDPLEALPTNSPVAAAADFTAGAAPEAAGDMAMAAPIEIKAAPAIDLSLADEALQSRDNLAPHILLETQLWQDCWLKQDTGGPRDFLAKGLKGRFPVYAAGTPVIEAVDGTDRCLVYPYERPIADTGKTETLLRFAVVPWDQRVGGPDGPRPRHIAVGLVEGLVPPVIRFRSPDDSEANALLDFLDRGVLSTMQEVTNGFLRNAGHLLADPGISLLRGLLSGYIALRSNMLEGLDGILSGMAAAVPSMPDINAQKVELHARMGNHDLALAAMADALNDDCPWFRSGLTYLFERMTMYSGFGERDRMAMKADPEFWFRMQAARKRIGTLAPYLVTGNPFTTFDIPK